MPATKSDIQSLIKTVTLNQLPYISSDQEGIFALKNVDNFKNNINKKLIELTGEEREVISTNLSEILKQLTTLDDVFINQTFEEFLIENRDKINELEFFNLDTVEKMEKMFKLQVRYMEALINEINNHPICPVCPVCPDPVPLEHKIKVNNRIILFLILIIILLIFGFVVVANTKL